MTGLRTAFLAGLLLALTAAPALAQMAPVSWGSGGALGNILVDQNGLTLYTLSSDSAGVSTCTGGCLGPWPAATVDGDTAAMIGGGMGDMPALGTMTRDDGSRQLTWNGMPLYRFARDAAPGDVNGNGINAFGGVWNVVNP
jgi:predicted lipoprotein with Yx(FWY)xxD motif